MILIVPEVLPLIDEQPTLIAELDAVTAGDERRRRVPRVVPVDVREPVERPVIQSGDVAIVDARRRALFRDANQVLSRQAGELPAAVAASVHAEPGLQQEAIVQRRRPLRLRHAIAVVAVPRGLGSVGGGGRRRWRGGRSGKDLALVRLATGVTREPGRSAAFAGKLLVPEHRELVSRGRLRREPERGDAIRRRQHGGTVRVGDIRPLRRVAGVGVGEHARHGTLASFLAHVRVEPHAVLRDGAAKTEVEVPHFPRLTRSRQPTVASAPASSCCRPCHW